MNWDSSRALIVFGGAAGVASLECVSEAAGWHGWLSRYHTTPFNECLTYKFPVMFVLVAVFLVWMTRDWTLFRK